MNEEAGIKGFLSDYKCYISYLKDMLGDGEFLSFADFCRSQEREELLAFGVEYSEADTAIEVAPLKDALEQLIVQHRTFGNSENPDLDTPPGYFAQGMGW